MCPKFFQKSRLKAIKMTATVDSERIITISTKCICNLVGKAIIFQDRGYENKGEIIYSHNSDNKSTNWRCPLCTGMDSYTSWKKVEIHSEKHWYALLCFGDACILCFGKSVQVCSRSLWFQRLYFEVYFILLGYGNDSHDDDKDYEIDSKCRPKKNWETKELCMIESGYFPLCLFIPFVFVHEDFRVVWVWGSKRERERAYILLQVVEIQVIGNCFLCRSSESSIFSFLRIVTPGPVGHFPTNVIVQLSWPMTRI